MLRVIVCFWCNKIVVVCMKYNSIIQFQPFSYSVFLLINLFVYSSVVLHEQLTIMYTDTVIGRFMPVMRGGSEMSVKKLRNSYSRWLLFSCSSLTVSGAELGASNSIQSDRSFVANPIYRTRVKAQNML